MKEIIGQREFELRTQTGMQDSIKAIIYKPYQVADEQDTWKCEWEVQKPERKIKRYGVGSDSLQALSIGIGMLKLEIESLAIEYKDNIAFLNQSRLWI